MKKCPICDETFRSYDDIVLIQDNYYHEDCLKTVPIKFIAFDKNNSEPDGFIGEFEEDDKTWASNVLEDGEYLEEKQWKVKFIDNTGTEPKIRTTKTFALDYDEAYAKMEGPFVTLMSILPIEEE